MISGLSEQSNQQENLRPMNVNCLAYRYLRKKWTLDWRALEAEMRRKRWTLAAPTGTAYSFEGRSPIFSKVSVSSARPQPPSATSSTSTIE